MPKGYTPIGPVRIRRDFSYYGRLPGGYDVTIEVRDLRSERDHGYVFPDGHHRVVVYGPRPKPRTKSFYGETAWSDANRYAGDCATELQRRDR